MCAGSMGCIHSSSRIKKHEHAGQDTGGVPMEANPDTYPEILQLTEVFLSLSLLKTFFLSAF